MSRGSAVEMNQHLTSRWIGRQLIRQHKIWRRSRTVAVRLQEVYLRDDIPCGSSLCNSCLQSSPSLSKDSSHYLVLDADSLVQFMEIWELPQITGIIFLASVVKEVLNRFSQHNVRKLRSLLMDRMRQCTFFDDEHSIYTWSLCEDQERNLLHLNERVKAVASWFFEHLGGSARIVVVEASSDNQLSDPAAVQDKFSRLSTQDRPCQSMEYLNVESYIRAYWRQDASISELFASLVQSKAKISEVHDNSKVSGQNDHKKDGKGIFTYKQHLSVSAIEDEVANGSLRVGIFHPDRFEPLEGFIHPSNKGEASNLEIFVPGRVLQNRALPGDLVAVRLLDSKCWQVPKKKKKDRTRWTEFSIEEDLKLPDLIDEDDDIVDVALKRVEVTEDAVPTGEVVGILQRVQRDYVACLVQEDEDYLTQSLSGRREYLFCIPMDRRIPLVRLKTRVAERLVGQRFVIRIDRWEQDSKAPSGHFVRVLGPVGDINTEETALMVENGINALPFSKASQEELPEDNHDKPWMIPESELSYRRDLRFMHTTCSIDPPGSKDVDDALSVGRLPSGLLEIGVHIADVSYFVRKDSLLDLEARARGTTVYMVGKTWHMLPPLLSESLCSLKAGVDRLAVSVVWTVDSENDYEIVDVWFGRTVIHSKHQLFYAQAQLILDGEILPSDWDVNGGAEERAALEADLLLLASFSQVRRNLRKSDGALELASSQLSFETSANKEPIGVDAKQEVPMNWIVAELMILANSFVASKIYGSFPSTALLRRHAPPKLDNFKLLLECCAARGFTLDASSNKTLADSLDRMRDSSDPVVENAFRALATRAMSEAEYCVAGEQADAAGVYHYGLALVYYTHFTSPIRRYADIIVHRMLLAACQPESVSLQDNRLISSREGLSSVVSSQEIQEVIDHINERSRSSKRVQKECHELYLLMFLQKYAKAEHAVIISIMAKGLVVFVPKYDLRVPLYLQDKKGAIILAAEDDKVLDATEQLATAGDYVLEKHRDALKIKELRSGKTRSEYKLMDAVWVQLRADGTRAHAPKLRVRLLAPSHPSVKAYIQDTRGRNYSSRDYYAGNDGSTKVRGGRTRRRSRLQENVHVLQGGVRSFALEDNDGQSKLTSKRDSGKRKAASSIYDVVEEFKRLKVAPIYVGYSSRLREGISVVQQEGDQDSNSTSVVVVKDGVPWMPSSYILMISDGRLKPSSRLSESVRITWLRELECAARRRARYLRSVLKNEDAKLIKRAQKERVVRTRARNVRKLLERPISNVFKPDEIEDVVCTTDSINLLNHPCSLSDSLAVKIQK